MLVCSMLLCSAIVVLMHFICIFAFSVYIHCCLWGPPNLSIFQRAILHVKQRPLPSTPNYCTVPTDMPTKKSI